MAERLFPIHPEDVRENPALPSGIPWDFVVQFTKQISANHSQSLERLAERGGLSWGELLCAIQKSKLIFRNQPEAAAIVITTLRTWEMSQLRSELAASEQGRKSALADSWCDVCIGKGDPGTGKPCICGGSGRAQDTVCNLRQQLTERDRRIAEIEGERDRQYEYNAGKIAEYAAAEQQIEQLQSDVERLVGALNWAVVNIQTGAWGTVLHDKARAALATPSAQQAQARIGPPKGVESRKRVI